MPDFYSFQRRLLPCVMAMTERGVRVDDSLRRQRLAALTQEATAIEARAQAVVPQLVLGGARGRLKSPSLFFKTKVCKACRNGKKKRLACGACNGAGKSETFTFNLRSQKQLADVLYNVLRLPARSRDGHITVDEEALKSLLALDESGLVREALRFAKLDTMREIYERLAPNPQSGCVSSVYNIAGTYTGRFSSSTAFYVPHSTNLQNLPAQEALRDTLFRVRDCLVPERGEVFVVGDLSQAEARVSGVLSEDWELMGRWGTVGWDCHRWTASAIFGKAESDISPTERFLGKKARHAFNYGLGYNKFWRVVNDDADLTGVAITLAQAKAIRAGYHALHPNLDNVWWNRVERTLLAREPMTASHCGWQCNFWPRFDGAGALDAETLRAAIAWEPQHTVVHVLNEGLLQLYETENGNGWKVLLQGHDSVLLSVKRERVQHALRAVKKALERPMMLRGYALTIPVELAIGENFGEMEKVV